jgi:PhzF family phenazine biosynthesis protein
VLLAKQLANWFAGFEHCDLVKPCELNVVLFKSNRATGTKTHAVREHINATGKVFVTVNIWQRHGSNQGYIVELDIFIVDAFTQQQFKGNSAAVVPVTAWPTREQMLNIAKENNLSETAFILNVAKGKYAIRWFSPITEIDFCGHATLAAAFVLFSQFGLEGEIEFSTQEVGNLFVKQLSDGRIEMSFPDQRPELVESEPLALLAGLSITPAVVLKNRQAYFAVMSSQDEVERIEYDSSKLKQLAPFDVVVTAAASTALALGEQADFVSRYFWPANGGDEDPVTGSIHSGLAPYWADKLGKTELVAYQASERGGLLYCKVVDARVLVSGYGVLYLKGKIFI